MEPGKQLAKELLTISRSKAARRCWRYHYLQYELGRVPIKQGEALFFGTLFHVGLEQWWLTWQAYQTGEMRNPGDGNAPLNIAIAAMRRKFSEAAADADVNEFDLVKAEELMCGYHFRWADDMEIIEVIEVESQFKMPLVNPLTRRISQTYELGGKIDVRIRLRTDKTERVVEHKTTTEDIKSESAYWTRLRMDGQVTQYIDGALALGDSPEGCLYDVAKRPTKKQKLATPEEEREYTLPKSCESCRDKAQAKHKEEWKPSEPEPITQDSGESVADYKKRFAAEEKRASKFKKLLVKDIPITEGCETCEPARIHARQRDADETLEEFRIRVRDHIAENPEGYFQRRDIIRLDGEMEEFRFDNWEFAKTMRERQLASRKIGKMAWPRNPDACFKWQRACEYFGACTGSCSINDDYIFRDKVGQHEELST